MRPRTSVREQRLLRVGRMVRLLDCPKKPCLLGYGQVVGIDGGVGAMVFWRRSRGHSLLQRGRAPVRHPQASVEVEKRGREQTNSETRGPYWRHPRRGSSACPKHRNVMACSLGFHSGEESDVINYRL